MDNEIYMLREEVKRLREENRMLKEQLRERKESDDKWARHMSEVLNSGDGVYRP